MRWKGVTSHLEPPPLRLWSPPMSFEKSCFSICFSFLFCSLWSDCHCGALTVNFHLIWGRCVLNRARLQRLRSAAALMKFYQQSQREPRRPAAIQSPRGGHKRSALGNIFWIIVALTRCSLRCARLRLVWTVLKSVLEHLARKLCPAKLPASQSHLLGLSLGFLSLISFYDSVGMKCFHHKTTQQPLNHTLLLIYYWTFLIHPGWMQAMHGIPTRPSPQERFPAPPVVSWGAPRPHEIHNLSSVFWVYHNVLYTTKERRPNRLK